MNENVVTGKPKRSLHPATAFILLSIVTIIVSAIASFFDMQATYTRINPITNELELYVVTVTSLLNRTSLRYMLSEAIKNFISFAPLVMTSLFLIALGVLEKSGLLKTIISKLTTKVDKTVITFLLFFFGILLNVFMETAYVILIPISAIIFLINGRSPLVGTIVGFSAVAFGFSINALITSMDISLTYYTNLAARIIDNSYRMGLFFDMFVMILGMLLLAWLGTYITEKIIVRKVGKYAFEEEKVEHVSEHKRRGFIFASIVFVILILLYTYMFIPNLPFSGLLLDNSETDYIKQLFGSNSYFKDSIPFLLSMLLIIVGIVYGISAKTFSSDEDIVIAMGSYMKLFGEIVIMVFFASQFIAYFRKTNIGTILTLWGAQLIKNSNFSGIPLIILTVLVIVIINLFSTSTLTKCMYMSPILVPTLMQHNITPEFSQTIMKASDSITNGITPLLAYFVIYLVFLNYYHQNKKQPITITKAISYTLPYTIVYGILWIVILVSWYIIGLPIGPGVYPSI